MAKASDILTVTASRWGNLYRVRNYLNGKRIADREAKYLLGRRGGVGDSRSTEYGYRTDWQLGSEGNVP